MYQIRPFPLVSKGFREPPSSPLQATGTSGHHLRLQRTCEGQKAGDEAIEGEEGPSQAHTPAGASEPHETGVFPDSCGMWGKYYLSHLSGVKPAPRQGFREADRKASTSVDSQVRGSSEGASPTRRMERDARREGQGPRDEGRCIATLCKVERVDEGNPRWDR